MMVRNGPYVPYLEVEECVGKTEEDSIKNNSMKGWTKPIDLINRKRHVKYSMNNAECLLNLISLCVINSWYMLIHDDASYDVYYNAILHKYTYFANVKYLSGIRTGSPNTTSAV